MAMRAKTRFSVEEKLKEGSMVQGLISKSSFLQKDIAERLGYSPNDISQWWAESNPTRIPDATFVKLGELLGFNPVDYRPWLQDLYDSLNHVLGRDVTTSFRTIKEIRHDNFLALIEKYGSVKELGEKVGRTYNYLTGVKCQHIPLGDKAARAMEEALGLQVGWMDNDAANADIDVNADERSSGSGVTVRQALKASGMTAAELSRKVGESSQTINGWLKRNRVPSTKLFQVAELLGVDAQLLTGGIAVSVSPVNVPKAITARELWSWMISNDVLEGLSSEELFGLWNA